MDYVGLIIIRKDGKMLFQLRDNKKNISDPNKWGLFGGGMHINEIPEEAIIREIKEELGVRINKKDLSLIMKIPFFKENRYIFRIDWDKKISDLKLNEGKDLGYFSIKEILIKKNVVFVLRMFLMFYPLIKLLNKT
jgi:8-oxo-dGTP diphosphatase